MTPLIDEARGSISALFRKNEQKNEKTGKENSKATVVFLFNIISASQIIFFYTSSLNFYSSAYKIERIEEVPAEMDPWNAKRGINDLLCTEIGIRRTMWK